MKRRGDSRRRRGARVTALGAIALALLAPAAAQAGSRAHASIVGGKTASILAFPSLAFIAAEDGNEQGFACTGTVIAPRLILTAAHCVEDLDRGGYTPTRDYIVATGLTNPHQAQAKDLSLVTSTHVFPAFNPGTVVGDAAVLVLATPTAAPAIPLASAADGALYEGGATVLLAGWGLTHANAAQEPRALRSTSTVVQAPASCVRKTRRFAPAYSPGLQLCATNPPDHATGGCYGDSGGPAIAQRPDGTVVEVGITSTGGPRCSTKVPNIFTRADRVSTWASEWIAAVEQGGPAARGRTREPPRMRRQDADEFVVNSLLEALGPRVLLIEKLRGDCKRLARPRVRCALTWRSGPGLYHAIVTVYYVLRQEAVVWDSNVTIRRVNPRGRLR